MSFTQPLELALDVADFRVGVAAAQRHTTEMGLGQASLSDVSADSLEATGAETPADALEDIQRMSSLEAETQERDDTECPTCGREDFKSTEGMRRHHALAHDESLLHQTVECDGCGDSIERRTDTDGDHYCSNGCMVEKNAEVFRNRTETECKQCGETFKHVASKDRVFCGAACQGEHERDLDESECGYCGDVFEHVPAKDRRFCSYDCMGAWRAENTTGDNNPAWKGGHAEYYGNNWHQQRRRRLEHDAHECVVCGITEDEHREQVGRSLDVHHIRPLRTFEDPEDANVLRNLVTMCKPCHGRWEGIPLRPEVVQ